MLTLRGDKFVYTPHLLHQNRQTPQDHMDRVDAGGTNSNTLSGQISIYLMYGQRVFTSPRPTASKVAAGNESQQKYGARGTNLSLCRDTSTPSPPKFWCRRDQMLTLRRDKFVYIPHLLHQNLIRTPTLFSSIRPYSS